MVIGSWSMCLQVEYELEVAACQFGISVKRRRKKRKKKKHKKQQLKCRKLKKKTI